MVNYYFNDAKLEVNIGAVHLAIFNLLRRLLS